MTDDRIIEGIAELLDKLGYENLGYNGDTLWFKDKDDHRTFSISVIEVEADEET